MLFRTALDRLGVRAEKSLMVGERWGWDGACTGLGLPALVIPPLAAVSDRHLRRALDLVLRELGCCPEDVMRSATGALRAQGGGRGPEAAG